MYVYIHKRFESTDMIGITATLATVEKNHIQIRIQIQS